MAPTTPEQRSHSAARPQCPNCGVQLPPRRELRPFVADVIAERCKLAMLDEASEYDQITDLPRRFDWHSQTWQPERIGWLAGAVAPLGGVRARAILLHMAEPEGQPLRRAVIRPDGAPLDERSLLERLGADLSRTSGVVRCPGPLHQRGDRHRSLSWRWTGSKALLHCMVGCSFDEIRGAA
jgi:hypothetical protein